MYFLKKRRICYDGFYNVNSKFGLHQCVVVVQASGIAILINIFFPYARQIIHEKEMDGYCLNQGCKTHRHNRKNRTAPRQNRS